MHDNNRENLYQDRLSLGNNTKALQARPNTLALGTDNALSELISQKPKSSQKVPLECLKHDPTLNYNFTQVRGNNVHVVAQHYNNGYYKTIVNLPLSYNLTTVL